MVRTPPDIWGVKGIGAPAERSLGPRCSAVAHVLADFHTANTLVS